MEKYTNKQIELLSIQVGCMLRYARLKRGISQEQLGQSIGSNSVRIGRIERSENICSWSTLMLLSQELELNISDLLNLKNKSYILSLIHDIIQLERKLTQDKKDYYRFLQKKINRKY